MKTLYKIFIVLITVSLLVQCKKEDKYKPIDQTEQESIEILNKLNPHDTDVDPNKPFYQGEVQEVIDAGSYTYLKIKENIKGHSFKGDHESIDFWIVVSNTPVKVGDEVRFQKELVTKDYFSKTLNRYFEELMFASNIQHKIE